MPEGTDLVDDGDIALGHLYRLSVSQTHMLSGAMTSVALSTLPLGNKMTHAVCLLLMPVMDTSMMRPLGCQSGIFSISVRDTCIPETFSISCHQQYNL